MGIYQLINGNTNEFILFGKGKHLSSRMNSLLPLPYGCGTRNNEQKRNYVLENLEYIKYRTITFTNLSDMYEFENKLKHLHIHKFNT